ncbi:MAG: aromatic ring-hydroxylating dioxygenase subunit alpha [Pseudomonadota bacterium]
MDHAALSTALSQVTRPVADAKGLPSVLYTSAEAFALERQKIFTAGWACIGFGQDVPQPGDAKPIDFMGMPLLMVRDPQGDLRVFENVCRHRGMILVDAPRNFGGVIRCPYHSWCYSLDGRLRATPHVGGPGVNKTDSIDSASTGLREIRTGLFMDVVFVNVSGTAQPFDDFIAPLRKRLSDFAEKPLFAGGADSSFSLDIHANWKLVLENNCESYHLPWVHPGLNSYSKLEDHYCFIDEGHSGQGTLVYNPDLAFPNFADLPAKWDKSAEYPSVYPNVFFSVHRDHFWAAHLDPKAPDHTIERVELYYASEDAAQADSFATLRAKNAQLWKEVLTEDIQVTQGMQQGRGAPNFDGGVFSPEMDSPTHAFHAWVARRLAA